MNFKYSHSLNLFYTISLQLVAMKYDLWASEMGPNSMDQEHLNDLFFS